MIRCGKTEGWLQLPKEAFLPWATLNDVDLKRTIPGKIPGRGGALLAKEPLRAQADESNVLMRVPRDLVLSLERVQEHAKVDKDFREVLDSLESFGRSPRGAILTFLLVQASMSCPHLSARVGVHSPFTEYIKSLPLVDLPTMWALPEMQLLAGTTLGPASVSKIRSLQCEYDRLCASASNTRWYEIVADHLDFDDWLQVDAMYRSRALDFPEIGHCMVPCIDLANHDPGENTVAIYEKDHDGNAVLMLRDGKTVSKGSEITITYGDEKGACEMLFSYGFLDHAMQSAETLFLSLLGAIEMPLIQVKLKVAQCAPGFKPTDKGKGQVDWDGDFIWLLSVNADDGLGFELARTTDGEEEVHTFFQDQVIDGGAAQLRDLLAVTDMWDVYRLRAVTILQQRIFDQLQILHDSQETLEAVAHGEGTDVRESQYQQAMKLRSLEFELMNKAYEHFEAEKSQLAESPSVVRYLEKMNADEPDASSAATTEQEEDFS